MLGWSRRSVQRFASPQSGSTRDCSGVRRTNGRVTSQRDPGGDIASGRIGPALQATKLHSARLRPDTVRRGRLTSTLAAARPALTLFVAPPGFGKTSLLADWSARRTARSFAWLTIDTQDNDQTVLWTYICAALGKVVGRRRAGQRGWSGWRGRRIRPRRSRPSSTPAAPSACWSSTTTTSSRATIATTR